MRLGTLLRVTESGGDVGLVRDLPGVRPELVRGLVEALGAMRSSCLDFADRLGAGTVHEHAFGKLIDASKVCDAYHDRLPATQTNLSEAREVAESFITEFSAPSLPAPREAAD
jgi:hypothetical protein